MLKASSSVIPCIVLLCLILLYITPVNTTSASPCSLQLSPIYEDFEYFEDGDVIIGGVISVHSLVYNYIYNEEPVRLCYRPSPWYYRNLLNFLHAIVNVRMEPGLLPNISLGYHLYDSCSDTRKAIKSVLQILSGPKKTVPNYFCTEYNKLLGIVGDHHSLTTVPMAQILGMYGYSQISYGATDYALSDRNLYPHFFRMLQNDRVFYKIICQLLKHYGWTWVGIIASDDDSGESEQLALMKYMSDYGICVDFLIKVNINTFILRDLIKRSETIIRRSSAKIIIIVGSFNLAIIDVIYGAPHLFYDKTLIFPPAWTSNTFFTYYFIEAFNGSLTLELYPFDLPPYGTLYDNINPSMFPDDKILENIWIEIFNCLSPNASKNAFYEHLYHTTLSNCTGKEYYLQTKGYMSFGVSPRVYYAVIFLMHALREMHDYLKSKYPGINLKTWNYRNQVNEAPKPMTHSPYITLFTLYLAYLNDYYKFHNMSHLRESC